MLIHCPNCNTEYDCEPGKYECECGAVFSVAEDGGIFTSGFPFSDTNQDPQTTNLDVDQTIPPRAMQNEANEGSTQFDPDVTIANMRIRHDRGELHVGDVVLNRYKLLEKLGSGAMGVVFKCRDQVSLVEYALKMVPPELARDADAMEDVRENFQLIHGQQL